MSKLVRYNLPCPECKEYGEYGIFHSVNTNIDNIIFKLINDEINFVTCLNCGNVFQVKTGLLFNNIKKTYAVYYNPVSFELIEKECIDTKRMFGENFYLGNPSCFKDWELFKQEIKRKEGLTRQVNLGNSKKFLFNHSKGTLFEKYWSCDICDGNLETGCLYFDPTECPKHT